MSRPHFTNTRFDPDRIEFHDIAKQVAKSVGYTAALTVNGQLAQLLRLRVSQLNPCSYCLILHSRAAREQGIAQEKIDHLPSWRESTLFSAEEQAALAYCEALTEYAMESFPAKHEALARYFDEQAIAEIAAIVINMNLWTRLKLAQGATPAV